MSKKIYVGNMNYNTSERQLQDLFAQYGDVSSVNIIVDRFTGKAKGFGFFEMDNPDAASAARRAPLSGTWAAPAFSAASTSRVSWPRLRK